jgi:hypothetical protein
MPTPKGKIPRVNVIDVSKIALSDTDWGKIEDSYGSVISPEARTLIIAATNGFIKEASAEATGRMEDAFKRVNRLHRCAKDFIEVVNERPPVDVTRQYVDDEISLSNEILNASNPTTGRPPTREYVIEHLQDVTRFGSAWELTLETLNFASQYNYWPDGAAWGKWVRTLTHLVEELKLPAGVRKDSDKNRLGKSSPFVDLIFGLQCHIPAEHVPQRTADATATAINRARSESKTNFPLKKPQKKPSEPSGD